jgi:pyrroloquinoline quinone (PQQ) biosynthesis protein C
MTMPYDGRCHPTPTYEPGTLSPDEFETAFCEALVATILEIGPAPRWPEGLSVEQARIYHGNYLKYMSFFAWKFPSWLMSVASLCPYQDVRREIIKDCVDEEVGDPDAGGRPHIELLYDEAETCGVSRQEIFATKAPPAILACINAWENLTRTLGWLPGYAAIGGLEITQSEPAIKARERMTSPEDAAQFGRHLSGATLPERLDLPEDALMFHSLHSYKDRYHGGGELAMIVKYANTRSLQEEAMWAVRSSLEIMAIHGHEVRRLAAEAAAAVASPVG